MWPDNKNAIPKSFPTDSCWNIFKSFNIKVLDGNIAIRT